MKLTAEMLREMIEGQIKELRDPPDVVDITKRMERGGVLPFLSRINTRPELQGLMSYILGLIDDETLSNADILVVLRGLVSVIAAEAEGAEEKMPEMPEVPPEEAPLDVPEVTGV